MYALPATRTRLKCCHSHSNPWRSIPLSPDLKKHLSLHLMCLVSSEDGTTVILSSCSLTVPTAPMLGHQNRLFLKFCEVSRPASCLTAHTTSTMSGAAISACPDWLALAAPPHVVLGPGLLLRIELDCCSIIWLGAPTGRHRSLTPTDITACAGSRAPWHV